MSAASVSESAPQSPASPDGAYAITDGVVIGGKLRVVQEIGSGGMASVYEVEHLITKHRRALKVLNPALTALADPVLLQRFLQEGSAGGRIANAHIIETFDGGVLPSGEPYLVMELLQGESLASHLRTKGKLSIRETIDLLLQTCTGIQAAHKTGIVHRDLKPENLFITRLDGKAFVKILDFGISKFDQLLQDQDSPLQTQDGSLLGTPHYMSPEMLFGEKNANGRVDIYALGVILYQCLAGQRPYEGDNFGQIAVAIHRAEPTPLVELRPELPPELIAIIERAMAKNADDRFPDARSLALALQPYIAGTDDDSIESAAESVAALEASVHGIRPFSVAAAKLLQKVYDPNHTIDEIASLIESDMAIAMRLLRVVNSAVYALRVPCRSVRHAVALLGSQAVAEVVSSAAILDMVQDDSPTAAGVLEHGSGVAALSRKLAQLCALPEETMYTCGLLHDVGKLMLIQSDEENKYAKLLGSVPKEADATFLAERKMLGFDHATLAAHMLATWKIPDPIPEVIKLHHSPERLAECNPQIVSLVSALRLADWLGYKLGEVSEPGPELLQELIGKNLTANLPLVPEDILKIWESLRRAYFVGTSPTKPYDPAEDDEYLKEAAARGDEYRAHKAEEEILKRGSKAPPSMEGDGEGATPTAEEVKAVEEADVSEVALQAKAKGLRPFPAGAQKLMLEMQSSDVDVQKIARIIEADAALAAQALKIVNAPGALRVPCKTIRHAVTLMGIRKVADIATAAAVLGTIKTDSKIAHQIQDHANKVAILARRLGALCRLNDGLLYTCGLLHDIGKLMFLQSDRDKKYIKLLEAHSGARDAIVEHEKVLYGFDHAVLAGHVLKTWRIPDPIPLVVQLHHNVDRAASSGAHIAQLVAVLRLADLLFYKFKQGDELTAEVYAELEREQIDKHTTLTPEKIGRVWPQLRRIFKGEVVELDDSSDTDSFHPPVAAVAAPSSDAEAEVAEEGAGDDVAVADPADADVNVEAAAADSSASAVDGGSGDESNAANVDASNETNQPSAPVVATPASVPAPPPQPVAAPAPASVAAKPAAAGSPAFSTAAASASTVTNAAAKTPPKPAGAKSATVPPDAATLAKAQCAVCHTVPSPSACPRCAHPLCADHAPKNGRGCPTCEDEFGELARKATSNRALNAANMAMGLVGATAAGAAASTVEVAAAFSLGAGAVTATCALGVVGAFAWKYALKSSLRKRFMVAPASSAGKTDEKSKTSGTSGKST